MLPGPRIFLVSDRTGITLEGLVRTLLSQFEGFAEEPLVRPFIDSAEKIGRVVEEIDRQAGVGGVPPIVFCSIADPILRGRLRDADARVFDIFDTFLPALGEALGLSSSSRVGHTHGMGRQGDYDRRVEALNFALSFDDGSRLKGLEQAQLILVGVSRSGKTPTCLYLAMQYRVFAANYPLTEDDFLQGSLPQALRPWRDRLFGLSIAPERLRRIREQRRAGSAYASLQHCRKEVSAAEALFQAEGIPFLDSTSLSIEELAVAIMHRAGLHRPA